MEAKHGAGPSDNAKFPKLSLRDGSSGLTIYAVLGDSFNCVEFTTAADKEQPIFISPWMQFEPAALQEARSRLGAEIIRRAMLHDSVVKQLADWENIQQSWHSAADRRDADIKQLRSIAAEEKRKLDAHDELVAALKGLLGCAGEELSNASDAMLLDGVGNGPDDLTKEQALAFLMARAALAKATGSAE